MPFLFWNLNLKIKRCHNCLLIIDSMTIYEFIKAWFFFLMCQKWYFKRLLLGLSNLSQDNDNNNVDFFSSLLTFLYKPKSLVLGHITESYELAFLQARATPGFISHSSFNEDTIDCLWCKLTQEGWMNNASTALPHSPGRRTDL